MTNKNTINQKTWDLLIECNLTLDETADIAKGCTEYSSSALKKQCRSQKILAKKVLEHLRAIEADENSGMEV